MRPLDLKPQKLMLVEFHRRREQRGRWDVLTTEQVLQMLGIKPFRRHRAPFAKTRAGHERRLERDFVRRNKCAFTCD